MKECTCNLTEAVEMLRESGFGITKDLLGRGLQEDREKAASDRIFPFGVAVQVTEHSRRFSYIIYTKKLRDFIEIHGGKVVGENAS